MDCEPILILADPNGKAWNFAKEIYEKLNANQSRQRVYNLGQVEVSKFTDGEMFIKVKCNVRKKTCYFIHDSSMPPQDWLFSLALVNDALMRSSARKINNVLPYMKFSRQDRMTEPRVPISTSVLANIINPQAYRVITTTLHNPAVQGAYKIPFDNLKSYPVIIKHLEKNYPEFLKNAVIVAPDVGSAQRAESYAKILGLDVAIAHKKRKQAGVIEKMTIIGDIEGKNALIVDDMIGSGGTLIKAAEILKERGANQIYACATHGIFNSNAKENLTNSPLDKIIVTDSIPQDKDIKEDDKIDVVTLTNLFAETIFRISHGQSISEMFRV